MASNAQTGDYRFLFFLAALETRIHELEPQRPEELSGEMTGK